MIFLPVSGFPGFSASADGTILGKRGRQMKPRKRADGYLDVLIGGRRVFVHKLVLLAFSGPKPTELHQARHLNGRRDDNRAENLVWGTVLENRDDKVRHGKTKLSFDDVEQIRTLARVGLPRRVLAARFKISPGQVDRIVGRRQWTITPA